MRVVYEDEHDAAPQPWFLWPDLVPVLRLWSAVQTQWQTDFGVRTGLDYGGVDVVMRRHGIEGKQADEMFQLLQAMEREALDVWAEQKAGAGA